MGEMSFNEDDKKKFVEFLNIVAKNATFNVKTDEIIAYFKLLSHMQNSLLPKISANILEVVKVVEAPPEAKGNE
jgi:hypothetical protein